MLRLDLDIERFWKDEETAHDDNCFSKAAKQAALGIRMSTECVWDGLGVKGEPCGYTDPAYQLHQQQLPPDQHACGHGCHPELRQVLSLQT